MSDLDRLFENAPEGAVELCENTEHGYLRWFDKDGDTWSKRDNGFIAEYSDYKTIATRPQPEYPPLTQSLLDEAKSEPEWTHIDAFGNPCSLLIDEPDSMGKVVILRQDGWYSPVARKSLKPIKPTISKAKAWDKICESEHEFDIVDKIKKMYEVVE